MELTLKTILDQLFPTNKTTKHESYLQRLFSELSEGNQQRFLNGFGPNLELIKIWNQRTGKAGGYFLANQVLKQIASSPTAPALNYELIPDLINKSDQESIFDLKSWNKLFNDFVFAGWFSLPEFGTFLAYQNENTKNLKIYQPKLEQFFNFLNPEDPYILDYVWFQNYHINFEVQNLDDGRVAQARNKFLKLKVLEHWQTKGISNKTLFTYKYSFVNRQWPVKLPHYFLGQTPQNQAILLTTNFRATAYDLNDQNQQTNVLKDLQQYWEIWKLIEIYVVKHFANLEPTTALQIATLSDNSKLNLTTITNFFQSNLTFDQAQNQVLSANKTFLNSERFVNYIIKFLKHYYQRFNEIVYYDQATYEWNRVDVKQLDRQNFALTNQVHPTDYDLQMQPIVWQTELENPQQWNKGDYWIGVLDCQFGEQFRHNILPTGSQINGLDWALKDYKNAVENTKGERFQKIKKHLIAAGLTAMEPANWKVFVSNLSKINYQKMIIFDQILKTKLQLHYDQATQSFLPATDFSAETKMMFAFGHFMEPMLLNILQKNQLQDPQFCLKHFGTTDVQLISDKRTMLFQNILGNDKQLAQVADLDGLIINKKTKKVLAIVECKTAKSKKIMSQAYWRQATLYALMVQTSKVLFVGSQMERFGNQNKVQFVTELMELDEKKIVQLKAEYQLWLEVAQAMANGFNFISNQFDPDLKNLLDQAKSQGLKLEGHHQNHQQIGLKKT